jgi:hypothetical protein
MDDMTFHQNSPGNTSKQQGSGDPKRGRGKVVLISLSMVLFAIFVYVVTSEVRAVRWLWGAVLIIGMLGGYHIARRITIIYHGWCAFGAFYLLFITQSGWAWLMTVYFLSMAVLLARSPDIHAFFDAEYMKLRQNLLRIVNRQAS